MNLVDYGRILIRRGWIMVLLAIIAAGAAYLFSQQQTPTWRATQRMLMVPSRTDFGLAEAAVRLLESHVAYLDSKLIAQQVIDRLELDMTPDQLKSDVTIASNQNRLEIQIDVDITGEGEIAIQQAGDIANAYGDLLIDYRNQENQKARREDRIEARKQDTPVISLVSPRPTINAIVGAVLGMLLGGVIIFVLEYLESAVIRRRDDLERVLDIPVLATVPHSD